MKTNTFLTMQKRLAACVLGVSLCAGPMAGTAAAAETAAAWKRDGDVYQTADGTAIEGVLSRGIDTSYWNQEIDWEQVKADDVDFVMLATRFRGAPDPYFLANAPKAHEAGLKLGAYIYSYATSVEMAQQEADFVLDLIKDYPISYPVAFDAEDNNTLGTLPPDQVSQVINAFCKRIEDAGYYPMVYANEYWLKNKIDLSLLDYDIWVARYNAMYTFENPSMWQATNTGSVNGIKGNVDINFLFTDYGSIIPSDRWRTIGGNTYYYQNHQMQKSDWIHDGTGWFYLDDQGGAVKGWMVRPEGSYYLDEADGRMATGWKELGGSWYYLKDSGLMATGWQQADGAWYYLDQSGRMETGWQEINGSRYHLADSGAMSVGWKELDGAWYYLKPSGAMAAGWQQVNGSWYYLEPSGVMATGWKEFDGAWYYLEPSGAMAVGWKELDGAWYYFLESGAMATGWQEIGGVRYYMEASGKMAANTVLEDNGVRYQADGNGACTPVVEEEVSLVPPGAENGQDLPGPEGSSLTEPFPG